MARIDALLALLDPQEDRASLHLACGAPPLLRQRGAALAPPAGLDGPLDEEAVRDLLREILPEERLGAPAAQGPLTHVHHHEARAFLVRVYAGPAGPLAALRPLWPPATVLPAPLRALAEERDGLIVCAGPPGSRPDAALAALLDALDEAAPRHAVILSRRPYPARGRRSLVAQRELDGDAAGDAVRAALRQGADTLLCDPLPAGPALAQTVAAAESALVLGALEAPGGAAALDLLGRAMEGGAGGAGGAGGPGAGGGAARRLGRTLRALLWQRRCPRRDGGEVLASELILGGPGLAEALAGGPPAIAAYVAAGRHRGMHALDDSLAALVEAGRLPAEDAGLFAADRRRFPAPL